MTRLGVLTLNFGEPDEPTHDKVVPFLERIFLQNMGLESLVGEERRARARQLAERRAPGLIEDYRAIGGSPLNPQADLRAERLGEELRARGHDARVYSAYQYTEPFIADTLSRARAEGVDRLVALPIYPLCGHSTTVAALDEVRDAITDLGWEVPTLAVSGWHAHPAYVALRVAHIRRFLDEHGLDLRDPDTVLYFSAHGTPVSYLLEGSRYDRYVEEHCRAIAAGLGAERYAVGFQNHSNRGIPWTRPDNEDRIRELDETHLVVDPVSFVHEQSETLAELDRDLRAFIEGEGKRLHRIPVPHDDAAFPVLLADLVEAALRTPGEDAGTLSSCRCRPGAWCTNGARDLPESPFVPPVEARAAP